jgi:DNA-directed RNA polymerase beta subunit
MPDFLDAVAPTPKPKFRAFDDIDGQRTAVYDQALAAVRGRFPIANQTHRLEVANADYDGDYNPSIADEKDAILNRKRLQRPIVGTVNLVDIATNNVVDSRRTTLAHVPHLNKQGLFIHDGTMYALRNQARLRPGVYVRNKQDGGTEAHFNVQPGTGRGFRVQLEPASGVFQLQVGQSKTRLYPVLKALGVDDDALKKTWGDDLFKSNWREQTGHDTQYLRKLVQSLGKKTDDAAPDADLPATLKSIFTRAGLDEDTTELTLGQRIKSVTPDVILGVSGKILKVARHEAQADNRDSQAFQQVMGPEALISERITRDPTQSLNKLLYTASKEGSLKKAISGIFTRSIHSLYQGSGLAQALEGINPSEIHDLRQAITRMGEGGIASSQSVSRDARGVQPSHFGFIDSVRAPESGQIGLDLRVADGAHLGEDGHLYSSFRNVRTGQPEMLSARQTATKTVAFPGEMAKDSKKVRAMVGEHLQYVDRGTVDYELPGVTAMFSRASNMVPLMQGVKSQRLLMGARMLSQALPLQDAEAPLVQSVDEDGRSFFEQMGRQAGAVHADAKPGRVVKADANGIIVRYHDGTEQNHQLYNNYPLPRKTSLHNTATVKVGDPVAPGQLLAASNFTNNKGIAAPGKNLRVAYLAGEGSTYDDSVVISESAAKKLSSLHHYRNTLDIDDTTHSTTVADYRAIYGDRYTKDQFANLDDDGVVKLGATVQPGDPLVTAVGKRPGRLVGALTASTKSAFTDRTQTWDHPQSGVVTDITRTKDGVHVAVSSLEPMTVGSKLSNTYGGKGVVSKIIPDDQMVQDEAGRPMEVLMAPTGIITRHNPASLAATLLGKIAEKLGTPYQLRSFNTPEGLSDFALNEAKKHGVPETENLIDPRNNRKIPNVFFGQQYILKLQHTAESKLSARDTGGYSVDDSPARGGPSGAKRVGLLDVASLISAGATEFLKDAKLVRGQRNDDYWRSLKMGETPTMPQENFANKHFRSMLQAAGVSIKERQDKTVQLGFMTDKDVDSLAQHTIDSHETFARDSLTPVPGGLFDLGKTGGAEGTRFSKIALPVAIPNPLAEEPIIRMLGLTRQRFADVLEGKEHLDGQTGPGALGAALGNINLDREIAQAKQEIRGSSRTKRDDAVRRLGYLTGLKKQGVEPKDLMITKIPVLPPKYRPVLRTERMDQVHDANYLYKDLMVAGENYKQASSMLGDHSDYKLLYDAAKAVTGLGDPVGQDSRDAEVKGLLRYAIGVKDSPKYSRFQRKVLGNSVDTVGRSVITIDPELDMDQVGVPAEMAWDTFRPFVIRSLVRNGKPASEAVKAVRDRTGEALNALRQEMKVRPVVYNRAPALHRFNYVSGFAKINPHAGISISQSVTKGLNADFDGDAISLHVPTSDEAVAEAKEKLLPSKNLIHPGTFDVHLLPSQEYLAGLYLASQPDHKRPVQTFNSRADALAAYKQGKLSVRDPVRILSD